MVPSWDQAGHSSLASELVTFVIPVPSAFMTKMSSWPNGPRSLTNAICPGSGGSGAVTSL